MKKLNIILIMVALLGVGVVFNGCVGIKTGHVYTADDLVKAKEAYKKSKEVYKGLKKVKEEIETERNRIKNQ